MFALDFRSLYPSIIMGLNLSPRNLVLVKECDDSNTPVDHINTFKCNFDGGVTIVGRIIDRTTEQIYPKILRILFKMRDGYKKMSKDSRD